jgi:tRNA (guanine6-N2)-methyltransferase
VLGTARTAPRSRTFDVSASFLGHRNYNRYAIEDALGNPLGALSGWTYLSRAQGKLPPHAGLSLRIHLADSQATVAVRIGPHPLHRRPYRISTRPGSLHPPVARALALLAGLRPAQQLVDPFCGAGTIPIEAELACRDVDAAGFDVDDGAVASARANGAAADVRASFQRADATALPLHDATVDRVATNPPWGSAAAPVGALASAPGLAWRELARVLKPDGRSAVLLPPDTQTVEPSDAGLEVTLTNRIRVSGALADACVLTPRGGDGRELDADALFGRDLEQELERSGSLLDSQESAQKEDR